jgi:hypothetical protein
VEAAAPALAQEAEGRISPENSFLPTPKLALLGLVAGNKLADVLEVVEREVTGPHFGEEVE